MSLNNCIQDVAPKDKLRPASSLQSRKSTLRFSFFSCPERAPQHLFQ